MGRPGSSQYDYAVIISLPQWGTHWADTHTSFWQPCFQVDPGYLVVPLIILKRGFGAKVYRQAALPSTNHNRLYLFYINSWRRMDVSPFCVLSPMPVPQKITHHKRNNNKNNKLCVATQYDSAPCKLTISSHYSPGGTSSGTLAI